MRASGLMVLLTAVTSWGQTLTVDNTNSPYVVAVATSLTQVTVASGGTLVVNAPLTVTGDMTVRSLGVVTVDPWPKTLKLSVVGTLTVESGAAIQADRKGLRGAPGIAFGTTCGETLDPVTLTVRTGPCSEGEGGSHASPGGGVAPSPVYGRPNLATPGAGGNGGYYVGPGIGGAGGGVVDITASSLVLNGQLRADAEGGTGNGGFGGGGAGGSVSLTVQSFSGAGSLSASGGSGAGGGAGGAGRIMATYSSWAFVGSFAVLQAGASTGTVYLINSTLDQRRIEVPTLFSGGESYQSVIFGPAGALRLEGRTNVTAPLTIPPGVTVTLASPNALDGLSMSTVDGTLNVRAAVTMPLDLQLNGQLILDGHLTVPNLTMTSSAVITHSSQVTNMNLTVPGRLTVAPGARIEAIGKGYPGGSATGKFAAYGVTIDPISGAEVPGSGRTNGGSHAGLGGTNAAGEAVAATYDTPTLARYAGGGGGAANDPWGNIAWAGGSGGGILRLTAGELALDGVICADGAPGAFALGSTPPGPPGGGAGGTVVLVTDQINGTGGIYARGGAAGQSIGAGGGGGIVHISTTGIAPSIVLSAAGGLGQFAGAPGVVLQTPRVSAPRITSTPPVRVTTGDPVAYQAAATGSTPITWALVTAPASATVSSNGKVNWVAAGLGPQAFSLKATNSAGSDTQVFAIEVVSAPVITSTAGVAAVVGGAYLYDSDGRAEATGSGPLYWATSIAPAGLAIDPQTADVRWTPTAPGTFSACLRVTNPFGVAEQCIAIVVSPSPSVPDGGLSDGGLSDGGLSDGGLSDGGLSDGGLSDGGLSDGGLSDGGLSDGGLSDGGLFERPSFTSAPASTAYCGVPYRYSGVGVPVVTGGAPLRFSLAAVEGSTVPEGLTVDAATGEFTWTPTLSQAGTHPVVLTAQNAVGSDHQVFSIVVACPDEKKLPIGCACASGDFSGTLAWLSLVALARRRSKKLRSKEPSEKLAFGTQGNGNRQDKLVARSGRR